MPGVERQVSIEALLEPTLVVDGDDRVVAANEAARAEGFAGDRAAWADAVTRARSSGSARAVEPDAARDRVLCVSARRLPDHEVLVQIVDARPAQLVDRTASLVGLVHELRNVAFGMLVTTEDLSARGLEELAAVVRSATDRLTAGGAGLHQLLEPSTSAPTTFELTSLIDETMGRMSPGKHALRRTGAVDAWIHARRDSVGRALELVLRNAILHGPPGTEIELALEAGAAEHTIVVRDHGPGFPKGTEDAVWSPFFRRRKGGLGLGLSIARRLVVEEGGRVRARTLERGGAEISLRLPAAPPP